MGEQERAAYSTMIFYLPQAERPRERLREAGPRSLSNAELIVMLVGAILFPLTLLFTRGTRPN